MTDKKAVALILVFFSLCFMFLTRIHGPRIFFFAEGDDVSYFAYARAVVLDQNIAFENSPLLSYRNGRGKFLAARYAIGPGFLWSPFFLLGHVVSHVFGNPMDETVRNGTSDLHWLFVGMGSLLFGLAGFLFLYFFLRRFFSAFSSCWSVILVGFSSPLLYYLFRRPLMAHSCEFFCLAAAAYYVAGLSRESNGRQILSAAFLTGLIFLCRWNDAPFVAAFALWGSVRLRKPWMFLAGIGAVSILQLLAWKYLIGYFYPGPAVFGSDDIKSSIVFAIFPWTFRHLRDLFFGKDWGIFLLSPVTLLTLTASLMVIREKSRMWPRLALLLPALPVCWIAANWPSHGGEYGNRYILPLWMAFAFLFAEILDHLSERKSFLLRRGFVVISAGALLVSFLSLSLFKSNSDTLTLHVGPTLYEHASDWVNHSYTVNAYHEIMTDPVRSLMTLGPSPAGYFGLRLLDMFHLVPAGVAEKFGDYFIKHGTPTTGYWAIFFSVFTIGASLYGWVAYRRA